MGRYMVLILLTLGMIFGAKPTVVVAESGSRQIIKAAMAAGELNSKRQGEIHFWSNTPTDKNLLKLQKAFNRRFELRVKIKRTPLKSVQFANRIVVSAQAGKKPEGDMGVVSPPSVAVVLSRGLVEDFDWVGTFGKEFPLIKRRVERVPPAFRNKVLDLYHLVYVLAYRTDRLKPEDLPKRWEDLSNPKWSGRAAVADKGYPFNYFTSVPGWSEKRIFELAGKIRDNKLIFAKGSPGVAAALETGEASLGVTTVGNVEHGKAKGVPLDWFVVPGIPLVQKLITIPKGAPNVNLARLFAAWVSTEGRSLFEEVTKDGMAWPDEDSVMAKRIKELGLKLTPIDTLEKAKVGNKLRKKINKIYLGK